MFSEHRARSGCTESFCGFYWHSTRIANKGTNDIFNTMKQSFQSRAIDGKVDWEGTREILFEQKKTLDRYYRNMMYHFALGGQCDKCIYWDDVYKKHLANVDTAPPADLTDEEILEAVMTADASSE